MSKEIPTIKEIKTAIKVLEYTRKLFKQDKFYSDMEMVERVLDFLKNNL